jgi:hypothetical protein
MHISSSFASDAVKSTTANSLGRVNAALAPLREQLARHPLYGRLTNLSDVCLFMEHHVFAVWDFMALLKALQRHLTCVDSLWKPAGNATSRRLINEMVLEEESDEIAGAATSHFEVYRNAMREAGADLRCIDRFLTAIVAARDLEAAFAEGDVPLAARDFVRTTFRMIETGKPHVIAAAFTFGREQAIPDIFQAMVGAIPGTADRLNTLQVYLQRHIELDGNEHGPKAIAMLSELCGDDEQKWSEVLQAAQVSLAARNAFWTAIRTTLVKPLAASEAEDHGVETV